MSKHPLELESPVRFLSGVGPRRATILSKNGIVTVEDLLLTFPKRYEDRSRVTAISSLSLDATTGIKAKVLGAEVRPTRRPGFKLFEMLVADETGQIYVMFPNQVYLREVFKDVKAVLMFGTVTQRKAGGLQFTNPEYEIVEDDKTSRMRSIHTSSHPSQSYRS